MSVMELHRHEYYQYTCESLNRLYYRATVKEGSNKALMYYIFSLFQHERCTEKGVQAVL